MWPMLVVVIFTPSWYGILRAASAFFAAELDRPSKRPSQVSTPTLFSCGTRPGPDDAIGYFSIS
jgi:hypothetical protein